MATSEWCVETYVPKDEDLHELLAALNRRALAALELAATAEGLTAARCRGKASAYTHAAELVAEVLKSRAGLATG